VLIEPTGATSTAWSTSGTGFGVNAASGFAGNLLDLQVNGSRMLGVASDGIIQGPNAAFALRTFSTNSFEVLQRGNRVFQINATTGVRLGKEYPISWSSSATDVNVGTDTFIGRDAANIVFQRNGTNAQTSRVYSTFTDASNYVRAALSSTSTAVTLAAETAGTGADDIPLNLTAAGTGTIQVNSVAEVVVSSTVAGLPAAPVVGMLTRVTDATAPAVGSTVAGGGADAALCWYNGANWSVIGV